MKQQLDYEAAASQEYKQSSEGTHQSSHDLANNNKVYIISSLAYRQQLYST